MRTYVYISTLLFSFLAFPQEHKSYFEFEISKHLKAYKTNSERAILNGNFERADFLFDSLVNTHLKGSYISEFTLPKVNGGTLETSEIENPFLLITKSAWEQLDQKEIAAINKMAKMYKGQVDIIILFWTPKHVAKQLGGDFNHLIDLTYVDERENNADHIIKPYKHSFGAPTCFFISEDKQILNIDKQFTTHLKKEEDDIAFKAAHQQIKWILFEDKKTNDGIISVN